MAELYRKKVTALAQALEHPETDESLRGASWSHRLHRPDAGPGEPPSRVGEDTRSGEPRLRIELKGNLAEMLGATVQIKRAPETEALSLEVSMVAGACNPRYLQLWSGVAWVP